MGGKDTVSDRSGSQSGGSQQLPETADEEQVKSRCLIQKILIYDVIMTRAERLVQLN